MTHSPEHTTLLLLGQLAGWLGVSIAAYLQVISPRRCEARYFWTFLGIGVGLIIAHIGLISVPFYFDGWLPAIGYIVLIAAQLYAAYWVHDHSDLPGLQESIEFALKS